MEAAGIQLFSLCPTNYLNVPSLKMSAIWSLGKHSSRPLEDASQILHFFGGARNETIIYTAPTSDFSGVLIHSLSQKREGG